jgi:ABC-2 type transport system ATP-binding protein
MTHNGNEWAVETEGLSKRFGDFKAVDGVTFSVKRGEIFGFLGPNGAGKTTTIRMLLSLLLPSSGSARVLGVDIVRNRSEVRRAELRQRIGYMSQRFSLYNDMSIAQNLEFFGGTYGVRGKRLTERRTQVLRMAGLTGSEGERASNLSGGWRQRLALGCAILHEPEILFLDEPTAGVDPISRRAFWDLLYDLSAAGRTVFVTTHYMDEAERCHRLALIQRGRLAAIGSPEEIVRQQVPGSIVEIECGEPARALTALKEASALEASLYGAQLHVVADHLDSVKDEVRAILEQARIEVRGMREIEPSLEDAFIASVRAQDARGEDL